MMEAAAGACADLLMECDEEECIWPAASAEKREEEAKEKHEGLQTAVEEQMLSQPVRIIPIPVQPVQSCSPTSSTGKSAGAPLSFMVNGQRVPLLPGGGGAELKLRSHPQGSVSGFTTVHIPVTLTLHSPSGTKHINTTASLSATVSSSTHPAASAAPGPTPIITGVVSGEAAQKVLSNHNVKFTSSLSRKRLKTLPSPKTTPRHKLLRKGELRPVAPPDCPVCKSQYKLITELRGFMCLCSPAIAQSLQNLKRKKKQPKHIRRSRENKTSNKVSRNRPGLSATSRRLSDDLQFDQFSSPVPPSRPLKEEDQSGPPPEPPHGKLVILVEDFYYGSAPGQSSDIPNLLSMKFSGPYRCIHCAEMLRNNIKLMSHMLQHVPTMDSQTSCPHCFRHFTSPLRLRGHLEAVHSQYESTVTCRICELAFRNEPAFLWHMKTTHKPGEMPYVCQVCDFRSSFYSDVWSHFQQAHADTRHLMCQYCLRVLRSNACYQKHFARHQKKHVLGCDKCRLRFLYVKERVEHKVLHHKTHVRPPQLSGLKPGTKVTVRTYSVVVGAGNEELVKTKKVAPCKVVDITSLPPAQTAPKRKTVESLGPLLSSLSPDRVSRPLQHCMECLNLVPDLRTHFPSLVRCSLCRFITCCSTSYANHMINNHATCRKNPQYRTIFQSEPRLSETLKCDSCTLSTCRGDVMAKHLTERPEHTCITPTHTERSMIGVEKHNPYRVTSFRGRSGTFVPIHLLPSGPNSTQLSVKPLTSPTPLCSPPAMTIKILGSRPQPVKPSVPSLSVPQLCTILTALCHGVPQASIRYQVSPPTIQSWIMQQLRLLDLKEWAWKTDSMAEWVLGRREQQLIVAEDVLLLAAKRTLGEDSLLLDCYTWVVDFMLRHDLGLQTCNNNRLRSISDNSRAFVQALCSKIQNRDLPSRCFGCMDELPVFIDLDQFSKQNLAAFQLFKSPEEKPAFDIVLSALSDGSFLRPLLFFQGTVSPLPEGFPDNVLLEARQEGFTEQDRLQIWVDKVWRPHATAQLDHESLLMVDIHRGHVTTEFRDALTSTSTDVVFIPLGCCARLQPLDVCVVPVVRDFLQARWIQLVCDGGLGTLGLDQLALTLACWLSEVASTLSSQSFIMRRSFSVVCNLEEEEDGGGATWMIKALTDALIQPLDTTVPGTEKEPEHLELLLVTEERKEDKDEHKEEETEVEIAELVKSLPALRQALEGDQDSLHVSRTTEPTPPPSSSSSPLT
ncbi:pogo transposable element with ZNF domain isoform X2 [Amphiprion ocellaris]|uniref:pogo transposable element with ZNF domain isoform X2 n=1 Tax=Amphiprion ocellaris TaxID=80972 RepID=UPI002410E431|nr:pogo transposable element with ZNF domain isoform X2 [Amphiprion ocellaris]